MRITFCRVSDPSMWQVYKATLLDGTPVAVKVQRPGMAAGLRLDFFLVRSAAAAVDARVTGLATSLTAAVDAFAAKIFGELDYIEEGRSAEKFAELYATSSVVVPPIFWERSSARVLTLGWVDGVKLSDGAGLASRGLDVLPLVEAGIQCSLSQLLQHGFFHAVRLPRYFETGGRSSVCKCAWADCAPPPLRRTRTRAT